MEHTGGLAGPPDVQQSVSAFSELRFAASDHSSDTKQNLLLEDSGDAEQQVWPFPSEKATETGPKIEMRNINAMGFAPGGKLSKLSPSPWQWWLSSDLAERLHSPISTVTTTLRASGTPTL